MAITALGTGGTNNVTWAAANTATRAGVDPSVDGCTLIAVGYCFTDGGTQSGGAVTSTGWTGTAPTWSTPVTAHNGSSGGVAIAYSTNAWTGSGSVQWSFTTSGDTVTGAAVAEITGVTCTFADDATAAGASTITLSPAGDIGVAAFAVLAATDHVWSGFAEVFDSTENVAGGVSRGSFAGDESSPTGTPSATPNTGTRCMVGLSFSTGGGTGQPAAISTPITLPAATPTGDLLPYVVSSIGAVLTASDDPSVTFSGYTPKENDIIVLFVSSTAILAIQADASMPSGWTNPLGDGVEINSDAHGMCCAWHAVTSAEESGVTLTYTATNLLTATATGYVHGVAIRRVDTTTRVDGFNTAQNSGNTVTPHVLAGITGSGVLLDGSLVVSSVAKDATGAYSSTPAGWTQLQATNTNQGRWTGTRNTYTTVDTDVTATNITPSAGDEYASITLAFNKVAGTGGTGTPAAVAVPITVPAATPLASSTVTPAALAVPVTIPQVTSGESAAGQPAALAVPITLPAVTPAAGSTVTPAALAVPVTLPAATASGTTGVVSDDFNRANSDTVGDPWVEVQGDWDISSNGVIQTDAGSLPGFLQYNVDLTADHWIEATLAVSNGSGNIGLMFRFDDTDATCLSYEVADGAYKLITALDGDAIGSTSGSSHTHATGEKYRVTLSGNTAKFFLNDVEVMSETIATYAGNTRVGLHFHENSSGVVRWDNFRAGPMPYVPNDTASPGAISVPVTVPQATPLAGSVPAPAAISVPVTVPAVTTGAGAAASPAATSVPVTVPAVTTAAGSTAAPAAIPVTVTLPAATAQAGATVTPAAIPINITVPDVTATGGTAGTATPAAIPVTVTVPQVTPQAGAVVTPAAIPVTVTLPAATGTGSTEGTAAPAAIQATVTVPQVTLLAGSVPTPAAITVPVSIPQATGQASHTATPTAIPVTITLPAGTAQGGTAANPAAIQVAVSLPTPTLTFSGLVSPEAIAVAVALGAVVATGLVPDAHPITFTVRETGYTVTVHTTGTTTTVREAGVSMTAREQR